MIGMATFYVPYNATVIPNHISLYVMPIIGWENAKFVPNIEVFYKR